MEVFLVAVLIGLIPAIVAQGKGRNFVLWWLYGAGLFIVALPHSLIMKANPQDLEQKQISDGMQKCPHCAEYVKPDAKVCRYCNRDIHPIS